MTVYSLAGMAQLSPPGLDGARLVSWGAVGFNQRLSKKWSTTIYVGASGQSDPDNFSTLKKAAIFVVNHETLYQFNPQWQVAFCTSLRLQELYKEEAPYSPQDPSWRKEVRYYMRLFNRQQTGRVAWTFSFRPEYRTFYTTNGDAWSTPAQLRFRLKAQGTVPINEAKTNSVVIANEWLFATDKKNQSGWSSLAFSEDRLSTYFRHSFHRPRLFLDIGMMHQLWKDKARNVHYTTYLSFDLLFQNPFGTGKANTKL